MNTHKTWNSNRVLNECKSWIKEHGELSRGKLRSAGRSDLASAIYRYCGGMNKIRKILKLNLLREERSAKKIYDKARKISQDKGYLPSETELIKVGKKKLARNIKDFGGYKKLRKLLKGGNIPYTHYKTRDLEEEIIKKHIHTYDCLSKISRDVGLVLSTVSFVVDRAISEGRLDSKYKRKGCGTFKKQEVDIIEKLETTDYCLEKIAKEVNLGNSTVAKIMKNAIKANKLNKKYLRLYGGLIQYQIDDTISLLKSRKYTSTEITEKVGIKSVETIAKIRDKAIAEGELDPSLSPKYIQKQKLTNMVNDYLGGRR